MCIKTYKTMFVYLFILFIFLYQHLLYAGDITIRTPEGRPCPADTPQEMSQSDIDYCHWYVQHYYIDPYQLNAVRIGNASGTYNCHGYAWSLSEGCEAVWIGTREDPDVETYFWTDVAWSNDGQPSYLSASESEATHSWYTDDDHSVRKIQNSYPCVIEDGRDYVSKWGNCGLYQHAKNHDCYYLKQDRGHAFKKLKTTHTGTLTNYHKTWIGAGGKTHTLSGNVTVPSGITLNIRSDAIVNLNGYVLKCEGTGNIISNGTINGCSIYVKAGSYFKGFFPSSYTIPYVLNWTSNGWATYVNSCSFTQSANLTVPSSKSLNFNPGVNIAFTGSYKIEDYGAFNCLGSAGNPVIINGQGYSRVDYTNSMVEIKDGASANLQYTNFTSSPYHLLIRNTSGATISHCNYSSFGYNSDARAITVYNSENSVNINNCSFTGSGANGIGVYALNTGTDVTVSDNTFTSCRYGIRCYSSEAFLTGNTIQNSYIYGIQADYVTTVPDYRDNSISHVDFTKWGIFLNSSSPHLMYNYIYDCRVLINGGHPWFATRDSEGDNWHGHNTVNYSAAPLIKVQNYASSFLGYGGTGEKGGYNSIYDCDLPHIWVENHSNVQADFNYWGPEGPLNYADGTSTITNRYPLSTNPNSERSVEVLSMNMGSTEFGETPVVEKTSTEVTGEEELFNQALQAGYKSEYEKAKEILKGLIDNNSGSKYAALSVVMYNNLTQRELRDPKSIRNKSIVQGELNSLLAELIAKPKEHSLRPFGLRFQALEYALARNYDSMISLYDRIIDEYPDTFHELTALYDAIAYHVEIKCDFKKAAELLTRMESAYPDDELTFLAHILVGENKEEFSRKSGLKDQTIKTIIEFRLNQAFPNPFNPSTTISFDLPEEVSVRIDIFDVSGRRIRTLLNEPKSAGTHQVVWNGQDDHGNSVASGLYVYRIQAGDFVQSKKMLFMK